MTYTCPRCYQTLQEIIPVKIDENAVKKEEKQKIEMPIKLEKYNESRKLYIDIVNCHNDHIPKNLLGDYKLKPWVISENYRDIIYIRDSDYNIIEEYPVIEYPKYINYMTRYIECPICNHKRYID